MKPRYLEVTFRNGTPLAAYPYLPRNPGNASFRTVRHEEGLLINFAADGRAIGIEITAPRKVSLERLNSALAAVNQDPVAADDLRPLGAV